MMSCRNFHVPVASEETLAAVEGKIQSSARMAAVHNAVLVSNGSFEGHFHEHTLDVVRNDQ